MVTPALFQLLLLSKNYKANDAEADFLQCGKRSGVNVPLVPSCSRPSSRSAYRLQTASGGGERVGLKVEFLLQDPGEDELGSDDGD